MRHATNVYVINSNYSIADFELSVVGRAVRDYFACIESDFEALKLD